ncbi:hypothetical protein GGX14DRAFT_573730 [Mycena pura]|uniref:Uncharacterized protein n=1 Tax=Mycena pura TaxID=153505 RepID=A0AAD6V609_9AGAR|nr:hypothetical protein GGX14DRAFT_573730 [Mycena pura]
MGGGPILPPELERNIFEIASQLYPAMIPTFLCVARRVLAWTEPLLYRVVRWDGSLRSRLLLNAIISKPPAFVYNAVKSFFLEGFPVADRSLALEVLRLCTGIKNFAKFSDHTAPAMLPILATMCVQDLAAHLGSLFPELGAIDLTHPSFACITHLQLLDDLDDAETRTHICAALPVLPALTHLLLAREPPLDALRTILQECPRLELLLIMELHWQANFGRDYPDARVVGGTYFGHSDYWDQWEAGAAGFPNYWTRAEEFIAKKRNGEIDGAISLRVVLKCLLMTGW